MKYGRTEPDPGRNAASGGLALSALEATVDDTLLGDHSALVVQYDGAMHEDEMLNNCKRRARERRSAG